MVRRLAERDAAVEATPIVRDDEPGPAPTYRARLLSVEADGSLWLQRPDRPGAVGELTLGRRVSVLAAEGADRLRGESRIAHVTPYRLNAQKGVIALGLEPATGVASDQRRDFYRVSTAGAGLDPVTFKPLHLPGSARPTPLDDDAAEGDAELNAPDVTGEVVNVSGGGLGVSVTASRRLLQTLSPSRRYEAELRLPGDETPTPMRLKLVHVQPLDGGRVFFGMKLDLEDPAERAATEQRLVKFATELERRQLQRRRRA